MRLRPLAWAIVLAALAAALAVQAWTAHRANLGLKDRMERMDREIRRQQAEADRMRSDLDALETDPYQMERELRKGKAVRDGERIVPGP